MPYNLNLSSDDLVKSISSLALEEGLSIVDNNMGESENKFIEYR